MKYCEEKSWCFSFSVRITWVERQDGGAIGTSSGWSRTSPTAFPCVFWSSKPWWMACRSDLATKTWRYSARLRGTFSLSWRNSGHFSVEVCPLPKLLLLLIFYLSRLFGWINWTDWPIFSPLNSRVIDWTIDWVLSGSIDGSIDWLMDLLVLQLMDWLIDRFIGPLIERLVGLLVLWLIDWLITCDVILVLLVDLSTAVDLLDVLRSLAEEADIKDSMLQSFLSDTLKLLLSEIDMLPKVTEILNKFSLPHLEKTFVDRVTKRRSYFVSGKFPCHVTQRAEIAVNDTMEPRYRLNCPVLSGATSSEPPDWANLTLSLRMDDWSTSECVPPLTFFLRIDFALSNLMFEFVFQIFSVIS